MSNYISRKILNKKYIYINKNKQVIKDKKILDKISKIYIPPAYKNVQIFLNQAVLAKGTDAAGRIQYIYSEESKKRREEKKHIKLLKLCNNISKLEDKIKNDLSKRMYTKEKLIALIITLMNICNFRGGNKKYEKDYGSYGLTTLHKSHIHFEEKYAVIDFIGKKGVQNKCSIKDKNIIKMLKEVYKMSNKNQRYLFAIRNENKEEINVSLPDINMYLEKFKITSKDLRMWNANILFLKNLKKNFERFLEEKNKEDKFDYYSLTEEKQLKYRKRIIKQSIIDTAECLHHTAAICKSSYINKYILNKVLNENNDKNNNILNKILKKDKKTKMEEFLKNILK
jgi:DNA topoisomerase-1